MPIPAYMWMKDDAGNPVDGSVDVAGREKSVEILAFDHEVRIPTDPDTGKPLQYVLCRRPQFFQSD